MAAALDVPRRFDCARPRARSALALEAAWHVRFGTRLPVACAAPLMGVAGPAASQALTLASAIEQTLARNPELRVYAPRLTAARARTELAALRPPLELQAEVQDAFGTGRASGFDTAETTFALSQVVELGNKRGLRVDARPGRRGADRRRARGRRARRARPRSRGGSSTSRRTRSNWRSQSARRRSPRSNVTAADGARSGRSRARRRAAPRARHARPRRPSSRSTPSTSF